MLMESLLIALGAASAMLAACTPQAPTAMAAVRLELAFTPSQFREETLNFTVSIGGQ